MSELAIWTDENGKVTRRHHRPESLDGDEYILVDELVEDTSSDDERATLYYNETDGLYYEYESIPPLERLSDDDRERIMELIPDENLDEVIEIAEQYL